MLAGSAVWTPAQAAVAACMGHGSSSGGLVVVQQEGEEAGGRGWGCQGWGWLLLGAAGAARCVCGTGCSIAGRGRLAVRAVAGPRRLAAFA